MDSCYMPNFSSCNCAKGCDCPHGFKCCTEHENPVGAKPTLGICVQEDSVCNPKTGHCHSDRRMAPSKHRIENFLIRTKEGYSDDETKNWKGAFMILLLVVFLLLFCVITLASRK